MCESLGAELAVRYHVTASYLRREMYGWQQPYAHICYCARSFCPGDALGEEDALGSGSDDDEHGSGELTEVGIQSQSVNDACVILCSWHHSTVQT